MQDYISINTDINGKIPAVTVKQYDSNSRFLHVTLTDGDLPEEYQKIFEMENCAARLLVELGDGEYAYIDGEIADPEGGIATFLLPGSVTQTPGTYTCEIRITEPESAALISTKAFRLNVEESLAADDAIEATPQYSALENTLMRADLLFGRMNAIETRIDNLVAAGDVQPGTVAAEVADAREGWDGTTHNSLRAAVIAQANGSLSYLGTLLNAVTWENYGSTFDGLPTNIFTVCNLGNSGGVVSDAPIRGQLTGTVITLGRESKSRRANYDMQVFIPQDCGKVYARKFDGKTENNPGAWSDWTVIGGDFINDFPQFRSGVNDAYASYNYMVSNVTDDGTFFVSQTATVNGETVRRWTDLPTLDQNFIIKNSRYSTNSILQTAIPTDTLNPVYSRIIARPGVTYTIKPWSTYSGIDARKKILAVGDSICAGWRNSGKGFVGDLGLPYQNKGISGTTMSNPASVSDIGKYCYRALNPTTNQYEYCYSATALTGNDLIYDAENNIKWSEYTPIPDKLILAKTKELPNFLPDIIIANGGHNDYGQSVRLGDIPDQPATDINTLDAGTVMGGLQRLFLIMINNYPTAERYFVTTHKINRTAQNEPEKNGYLPTKINTAGYTETDLHDAIVQCCNVYNVKVIDIFNDSPINSLYSVYRGQYYYGSGADNPSGTSAETDLTNYFDKDGVHPLERGYLEGYVPLILAALKGNTSGNISRPVGTMADFQSYVMGE